MTLDQLKALIDEHIQHALEPRDSRSVEGILDPIDRNMWTPPPGAKPLLELLREDRDA